MRKKEGGRGEEGEGGGKGGGVEWVGDGGFGEKEGGRKKFKIEMRSKKERRTLKETWEKIVQCGRSYMEHAANGRA